MLIKALCDYSALQENKTPAGYCKQAMKWMTKKLSTKD